MGKTYRKDDDYNGYRKEQSKKNSKNFRKERKNSKEYYLSSDEEGFTVIELIFAITVILGLVGYVANIVKLISFATSDIFTITGIFILRVIGVFLAPFGCILGFF